MRVVALKKKEIFDKEAGNFRPIAIMNVSAKVIELAILQELD